MAKAEPILLIGEAGTGKTHLATGLCVAACRQRRRVRFTTATALINELAEAAHANQLSRALGRWERLDLICIDELGYVPLAETACELMFQVIADRAEKAAVIVTTNLPFSEWSQVIPNPRLCKALIDRLTDRAHIITTGTDSYRFRRTTAQRKSGKGIREDRTAHAHRLTHPTGVSHYTAEGGPEFISTDGPKFIVTARYRTNGLALPCPPATPYRHGCPGRPAPDQW